LLVYHIAKRLTTAYFHGVKNFQFHNSNFASTSDHAPTTVAMATHICCSVLHLPHKFPWSGLCQSKCYFQIYRFQLFRKPLLVVRCKYKFLTTYVLVGHIQVLHLACNNNYCFHHVPKKHKAAAHNCNPWPQHYGIVQKILCCQASDYCFCIVPDRTSSTRVRWSKATNQQGKNHWW
jgi:hypothetical protein